MPAASPMDSILLVSNPQYISGQPTMHNTNSTTTTNSKWEDFVKRGSKKLIRIMVPKQQLERQSDGSP
jgi:hypothetical protein